ncbi:MAG: TIGR01212 family radical SAM protein [Oscillospiraceae bacterium]|nr:TIGR01212 family radical SAM protein [Oscillospiraceae bacterium]
MDFKLDRYNSLSNYLKKEYGEKIYKLSFDSGCTCPNRDGFLSYGGCIFCSNGGSGDFAEKINLENIDEAFKKAKQKVQKKTDGTKYIAYFQSFTNTYGDINYLESLYTKVILREDVAVLSVATRPDCISSDVLNMLRRLASIKPVWVELGFQTSNEKTAEYIRRGYKNEVFKKAVKNLNAIGVLVVAHVILGLPNESLTDMKNTVRYVCDSGVFGIKLQLLHVLENTDLAKDYRSGFFSVLTMDEYVNCLCEILPLIPEEIVIHRLTGDGPKKLLLAPIWSADKKNVINTLRHEFSNRDIYQGACVGEAKRYS